MKPNTKKSAMTDREKVINDMISATRKNIIAAELEKEFLEATFEKTPEPKTEEEIQGYNMVVGQVQLLGHTIKVSIEKLNFLKQKRTDFHTKNAMKDFNKYPATINGSQLVEIPGADHKSKKKNNF